MKKSALIILVIILAITLVVIVEYFKLTGFAVIDTRTSVIRKISQISDNPLKIGVSLDVKSSDFALGISEEIPEGFNLTSSDNNAVNLGDRIEWLFVPGENVQLSYALESSVNSTNFSGKWFSTENEGDITGDSYFTYQKQEIPKEQWASDASGEYYNDNWKLEFATEANDAPCSSWKQKTAWCKKTLSGNGAIELKFDKSVYASGLEIYFTGVSQVDFAIEKVELVKNDGSSEIMWQGTNNNCKLKINFTTKNYLARKVRITTKSGYWGCVDAVKLIGI